MLIDVLLDERSELPQTGHTLPESGLVLNYLEDTF